MGRIDAIGVVVHEGAMERDIERLRDPEWLADGQSALAARRSWYLPVKAVTEWLVALLLVVASAPLLVLLATLVKLTSSGPAFYSQSRLGRHGRTYRIVKLRTMVQNAESRTGAVWAAKNDCRITPLGRILRSTHLDELPQLWNVLCGDMSLIGPRPERPEIARRVERQFPEFRLRLMLRPGITGLAQMRLPADDPNDVTFTCVRKKLVQDLYYVKEVGPLLDVRILLSTAFYFLGSAIDAIRPSLLDSHGLAAENMAMLDETVEDGCERVA